MLQNSKVNSKHLSPWNCWVCCRFNPWLALRSAIMATCFFLWAHEPNIRDQRHQRHDEQMRSPQVLVHAEIRSKLLKKELAQVHSEPSCLLSKKHFTARNLLKKENTERPRGLTWLSNSYCDSLLREETHRWTNLFHHHLSSCKIFKTYLQ